MGVPLFFPRVIKEHFPSAISKQRPRCTTLAIDFAGIEHTVLAKVKEKFPQWTLNQYLKGLEQEIIDLIQKAGVQKRLIICRDGMPPLGKVMQQRERRFRAAREAPVSDSEDWVPPFESNALSPGTEVSIAIDNHISAFLSRNVGTGLPQKIIFSGYRVPGEGEHKIIEHIQEILKEEPKNLKILFDDMIRSHYLRSMDAEAVDIMKLLGLTHWETMTLEEIEKLVEERKMFLPEGYYRKFKEILTTNESILVYGLDADLIFLTLPIEVNLYLWRYNEYLNTDKYNQMLSKHGDEAKAKRQARIIENLYLNLKILRDTLRNKDIGISEFIMGGFIFGNDFLPYLPGFNMVSDVSEAYINNLSGRRFADPFDLVEFQDYLGSFENIKEQLYKRVTGTVIAADKKNEVIYPSRLNLNNFENEWRARMLFQKVIPSNYIVEKEGEQFSFPPAAEDLRQYSINYLKTIYWCYQYYKEHRSVSWEWVYYNFWAPPIDDLLKIELHELELNDLTFRYPRFNLAGLLLLILPRNLKTKEPNKLIPKKLQIFQKPFSPIYDFYPVEFKIYRDGVNKEFEGFPLIPQIDYFRFVNTMDKVEFSIKDNVYTFSSIKRYEGGALHSSLFGEQEGYDVEDREVFLKPSPLVRFRDLWAKKATEIYGASLLMQIIPRTERHFSDLIKIEELDFSGFPNLEVKRKIL